MRTHRIPAIVLALACVASVGSLHAQQTTLQRNDQPDAATTSDRAGENARQGVPLTQAIAHKLQKANEAEIELAQLAVDRSDNPQVKEFAKTLINDHQACLQKLKGVSQGQASANGTGLDSAAERQARNADRSNRNSDESTDNERSDAERGQRNQDRQANSEREGNVDRQGNADRRQGNRRMGERAMVPGQLVQIMNQACDNSLQMTKEMLQKYEGQDFSMAFLGQQCVAHTMMLAELKAIASHGPEELKGLAKESIGKVEGHLETAKQLAKKLEDDRNALRSASRK